MRLTEIPLLAKKPEAGKAEPFFVTAEEGTAAFSAAFGTLLLITDRCGPTGGTVTAVIEGSEALPLFALPETAAVVACGGANSLRVARFFAEVRGLPCLLIPTDAALDGAYERSGEVSVDGELRRVPLRSAAVICDAAKLEKSAARAYCRLLLARLALFEQRALARFGYGEYGRASEYAYSAVRTLPDSVVGIAACNARLRQAEAEGRPIGECEWLAAHLPTPMPELDAYRMLFAAYAAFFKRGRPRPYFCADYRLRAREADVPYTAVRIPTVGELAARAAALEGMRALCNAELFTLTKHAAADLRTVRKLCAAVPERDATAEWKKLPEHIFGLTAVMRDFGLLEF